jgi:hypothetical protein
MSEETQARLREAMTMRGEQAMAHTDTERELHRFRHELVGHRRTRRVRIAGAVAAAAAAAAGVAVLVWALSGSDTKTHPAPVASPTSTQAATPTLPADYPLGTWVAVPAGKLQAQITFIEGGIINLRESFGNSNWHVSFPAPHLLRFGAPVDTEEFACSPATYRYHVAHKTLAITPVGKDTCLNRTSVITHRGRVWKFSG